MPSNLYGVSNCPGLPASAGTIGGASVACPASAETNIIASAPLIAPTQGWFYCSVMGVITVTLGATAPTNLTVAIRFTGGSDATSYNIPSQALVAGATIVVPVTFYTAALTTNWLAPGSVLNVSLNPQAQGVTAISGATYAYFALLRAPDQ